MEELLSSLSCAWNSCACYEVFHLPFNYFYRFAFHLQLFCTHHYDLKEWNMKKETGGICFKPRLDLNLLTDTFTHCTIEAFFVYLVLTLAERHCIHICLLNVFTDTSKQHTRLRKKNTHERSQLKSLSASYNALVQSNGGVPLTMDSLLARDPPPTDFGQSDGKSAFSKTFVSSFSTN